MTNIERDKVRDRISRLERAEVRLEERAWRLGWRPYSTLYPEQAQEKLYKYEGRRFTDTYAAYRYFTRIREGIGALRRERKQLKQRQRGSSKGRAAV